MLGGPVDIIHKTIELEGSSCSVTYMMQEIHNCLHRTYAVTPVPWPEDAKKPQSSIIPDETGPEEIAS